MNKIREKKCKIYIRKTITNSNHIKIALSNWNASLDEMHCHIVRLENSPKDHSNSDTNWRVSPQDHSYFAHQLQVLGYSRLHSALIID